MPYDPKIHRRRSIRLRGYDYSQPGKYSVTICTQNKEHLFGQVVEGEMHRNELGEYVALCWEWLAGQYSYVNLDEWTVMPNHLHGIIVITDGRGASRSAPTKTGVVDQGASRTAPTKTGVVDQGGSRTAPVKRKTLGRLVGAFKTVSTDRFNEMHGTPGAQLWQRDFYDHIIRNEDELNKIREYIRTNPLQWDTDPDFT
jgi:REP element-mobilizing transposase RayT